MTTVELRNRLRAINTEYSELVRNPAAQDRGVRMGQLRKERNTLMGCLATDMKPLRVVGGTGAARSGSFAESISVDLLFPLPIADRKVPA